MYDKCSIMCHSHYTAQKTHMQIRFLCTKAQLLKNAGIYSILKINFIV